MPQGTQPPRFGRDTYRKAIEGGDTSLLADALATNVEFYVPLRPEPMKGRDKALQFLGQLVPVFRNFRFTDDLDDAKTGAKALVFKATVPATGTTPEVEITVTDMLRFDRSKRINELMAMVRPFQGLQALAAHGLKIPE